MRFYNGNADTIPTDQLSQLILFDATLLLGLGRDEEPWEVQSLSLGSKISPRSLAGGLRRLGTSKACKLRQEVSSAGLSRNPEQL